MSELLVRGGTLIDGTGATARRADVRVRGGVVVEIGPDLAPDHEVEIDASGAYVAPGFIESHSHYDGAMWWDPSCDPLPAYGTTTALHQRSEPAPANIFRIGSPGITRGRKKLIVAAARKAAR